MSQGTAGIPSEIAAERVSSGVFARKSSGLVRNISTFDTFFYNLVQLGPAFAFFNIAYVFLYPGANMEIAALIALGVCLFQGVTYGLFASVYPRSGGEYVPLSRAIHPFVGFVGGFNQSVWQGFQTAPVAVFAVTVGLAPMFVALGLQMDSTAFFDLGLALDSPWGWFIAGALIVLASAYVLHRGMNVYFRIQRWLFGIGTVGFVILILVLILGTTGVFDFQASYAKYFGSGAYSQLLAAAQETGVDLNPKFDWRMTRWFTIWPAFSFLFAVLSTSFSGEIKDVKRGQLIGMVGSQIVGGILIVALGLFARTSLTNQGMLAIGAGSDAGAFPLPYPWISMLAAIMADNVILTIVMNLGVTLMLLCTCASTIVYFSRGFLAFGIDGMGPEWLAEVHKKYHTPTNTILLNAIVGVVFLVIYCFTDWMHLIVAQAGLGIVLVTFTLSAAIFPFIKRKTYETSPAKMEIAGIPVMTITGLIGSVGMAYFVYRTLVDNSYGANAPIALGLTAGIFVVGAIWYFIARAVRRRQGIDVGARFKEIPIE
jgi:amino acid transporter